MRDYSKAHEFGSCTLHPQNVNATLPNMLKIDRGALERLIALHVDNPNELLEEGVWPVFPSPDRSTLWRWRNGKTFPRNAHELFGLAGALDVDPIALLSSDSPTFYSELCKKVWALAWSANRPKEFRKWWFLRELISGGVDWPSEDFARRFYQRQWRTAEHVHRTSRKKNYYGAMKIVLDEPVTDRVWYFAWRDRRRRGWRPYGIVRGEETRVHLFNFDGVEDEACRENSSEKGLIVETWFGPGDADFRVASLHDFTMETADEIEDEMPRVRFSVDHQDDGISGD